MVRLTCLLRRKPGTTPAEFHDHWRNVHGPLIVSTRAAATSCATSSTPVRCRTTRGDDDPGYDGVTVQWFASMDEYRAHMAEDDFAVMWADIERFLDTDRLEFVVTEHPVLVIGDEGPSPFA